MTVVFQYILRKNIREILIDIVKKIGYTNGGIGRSSGLVRDLRQQCSRFLFCVHRVENINLCDLVRESVNHETGNIKSVVTSCCTNKRVGVARFDILRNKLVNPNCVLQNIAYLHQNRSLGVESSVQTMDDASLRDDDIRINIVHMNNRIAVFVGMSNGGGIF